MHIEKSSKKLRHEFKYLLDYGKYLQLSQLLRKVMVVDPYVKDRDGYYVRSLYFDDYNNTAFFEKEIGVSYRKKFRIRIYDFSNEAIKMEVKIKHQDYIEKKSCEISLEQYNNIYDYNINFLNDRENEVKTNFYYEMKNKLLKPKVIVDYLREAYILPYNDIRITIDKNLRAFKASRDIFDSNLHGFQVLNSNDMILEVKFNNFLPNHLKEILKMYSSNKLSVSKYLLCRERISK